MYSTSQRNRFTKKNRLQETADYRRVFNAGHEGYAGTLKWFAQNNSGTTARLGITIPKRLIKTAAQRNRIKRLVRESFRLNQEMLIGIDVIVVLRKPTKDEQRLRSDLNKIWSQITDYRDIYGLSTKAD